MALGKGGEFSLVHIVSWFLSPARQTSAFQNDSFEQDDAFPRYKHPQIAGTKTMCFNHIRRKKAGQVNPICLAFLVPIKFGHVLMECIA